MIKMATRQDYLSYIIKQINTTPFIAEEFLKNNGEEFHYRNAFDNLKTNVNNFLDGFDENRFIIMPGLRGVGKSTLLFQTYKYLIDKGIDKNRILYVPVDELKTLNESNLLDLINVFVQDIHHKYPASLTQELFVLIDEAQEDSDWSQTGKIINDQSKKIFMLFTGSNALEFELNLNSVRRTLFERIYPMNFQEYLHLKYDMPMLPISDDIMNMLLTGNTESSCKKETQMMSLTSSIGKPLIKEF